MHLDGSQHHLKISCHGHRRVITPCHDARLPVIPVHVHAGQRQARLVFERSPVFERRGRLHAGPELGAQGGLKGDERKENKPY